MAERKLDLIELRAALVGQLGVGTPQIMRRDFGVLLDAAPNALGGEGLTGEPVALVDAPEHGAGRDLRRGRLPGLWPP